MTPRLRLASWPLACVFVACALVAGLSAASARAQSSGRTLVRPVVRMYCQTTHEVTSGTAFVVAPGVVATNHHVIKCAAQGGRLVVVLSPSEILEASVQWSNAEQDLALVAVSGLDRPAVRLVPDAFVESSDDVLAVGFPAAADLDSGDPRRLTPEKLVPTVTRGIVSRAVEINGVPVYQTDARISSGNSGGPLFNRCGDVIGVNSFVSSSEGAYAYAVRASVLARAMQENGISAGAAEMRCADRDAAAVAPPVVAEELPAEIPGPVAAPPAPAPESGGLPEWAMWGGGAVLAALLGGLLVFGFSRRSRGTEPAAPRVAPRQTPPAAVPPPAARPSATVVGTAGPLVGQRFALSDGTPLVFGRDPRTCSVVLPENANAVSKRHAVVGIDRGHAYVQDLGSTNGTYVGGIRLTSGQRVPLGAGATVSLGHPDVSFTVHI